jgi:hypothetical protein
VADLGRSAKMKIRGGIKIGDFYESWPSAQLSFEPERLVLRYRDGYVFAKEDLKLIRFLRGTFTTEIRIEHRSVVSDSPIRFFPLFSRDAFAYAKQLGLPVEEARAPFYTKGDFLGWP